MMICPIISHILHKKKDQQTHLVTNSIPAVEKFSLWVKFSEENI